MSETKDLQATEGYSYDNKDVTAEEVTVSPNQAVAFELANDAHR